MRPLTNEKRSTLKDFFIPDNPVGDFLIKILPLTICWSFSIGFFKVMFTLGLSISVTLICILVRYLWRQHIFKKALFVYVNGYEGELAYQSSYDNWSHTANGWPQQVITFTFRLPDL